jgi:hypothetical protein
MNEVYRRLARITAAAGGSGIDPSAARHNNLQNLQARAFNLAQFAQARFDPGNP